MRDLHHVIEILNQTLGMIMAQHNISGIGNDVDDISSTPDVSGSVS